MKIEIRNLKKVFGTKTAVDIEKADIHDGEILGLVGNNGAGKTTLFRLILDLLNADEGSVMLTPNMTDGTETDTYQSCHERGLEAFHWIVH